MEEDEKLDYRTHLISQLDSMIDSGVPIYDITLANKKAIKVNYRDKIEELEKENKELKNTIDELLQKEICLRYYIPKSKIEDKIKELDEMKVDGEVFGTAVNYAKLILKTILEE